MLKHYYADLHIHIGSDEEKRPVKITGSKSLTLSRILQESSRRKGLDLIGVVDCHVPAVQKEIATLLEKGQAIELEHGGIRFESVTLLLGVELELYDQNCDGPIHVLCFLPYLKTIRKFTEWLSDRMTNIHLSSQRVYVEAHDLQKRVKQLGGLFIPAHVFTPFKSLYGKGVKKTLKQVFLPDLIDAIELGLSSDTKMAEKILELNKYTFLSNSDAHSFIKIAREYQKIQMKTCNFTEFSLALKEIEGRGVTANYGMHPKLGKYYQSVCKNCGQTTFEGKLCLHCGKRAKINGVAERIAQLSSPIPTTRKRPPYYYHAPLDYIHGLGRKTYEKLLDHFGTEMAILHEVDLEDISELVGDRIAQQLLKIRSGKIGIKTGGGGHYGKIIE